MSDRPRKNSNNRDRNGETVKNKKAFKNGSATTHRTPTQAFKPGRTEERPPKRPFSASPSCGQQAPAGVAADEARNLWSLMAGVNTPLFRSQIRPLRGVFHGESQFGSRSCGFCQNKKPPAEAGGLQARIPSRVPCITRARPNTRCPRTSVRGFFTNVAVPFRPIHTNASAVSAGAGPYFRGAIVKLARPWLTLRTAAE